jgi:hypothetical protein
MQKRHKVPEFQADRKIGAGTVDPLPLPETGMLHRKQTAKENAPRNEPEGV